MAARRRCRWLDSRRKDGVCQFFRIYGRRGTGGLCKVEREIAPLISVKELSLWKRTLFSVSYSENYCNV
jgi:hypothetical protein